MSASIFASADFTVIKYPYKKILSQSNREIKRMIRREPKVNSKNYLNQLILKSSQFLLAENIPYHHRGAMGEGNWCGTNFSKTGCKHIQQDLTYRTDSLDCFTLVQLVLALVNTNNLATFQQRLLRIDYGADTIAGMSGKAITYYNRNNFTSADFNPVNQKRGIIKDVTNTGVFKPYVKQTSAMIDRAKWFLYKARHYKLKKNVRVLRSQTGKSMVRRLEDHYASFYKPEKVSINYIPKQVLVKKVYQKYMPNEALINKIPTPSVLEIVRDTRLWMKNGKNIQHAIGSGLNVSHTGLLYKKYFKSHQLIYQKITCKNSWSGRKQCEVRPVFCRKETGCKETMMLAATNAYPLHFVWSLNKKSGQYACTSRSNIPYGATRLTSCNRVEAMPLGAYIARKEYGQYIYMQTPSILGVNIEKIKGRESA
jgi:hypothetical protein